jgi:hypothetical protein
MQWTLATQFLLGVMVRDLLNDLSALLTRNGASSLYLDDALRNGGSEPWEFLTSNELWGGMGSIADQSLIEDPMARGEFEALMIRLGGEQLRLGKVNARTEWWVAAFEEWQAPRRHDA